MLFLAQAWMSAAIVINKCYGSDKEKISQGVRDAILMAESQFENVSFVISASHLCCKGIQG